MIALRDALKLIDATDRQGKPVPFSLRYCKISTGEIIVVDKAVKSDQTKHADQNQSGQVKTKLKRKPKHSQNRTRNIRIVGTDQIRTIGIYRITAINGHKIIV